MRTLSALLLQFAFVSFYPKITHPRPSHAAFVSPALTGCHKCAIRANNAFSTSLSQRNDASSSSPSLSLLSPLLASLLFLFLLHPHPPTILHTKKMPFYAFQVRRRLCTISHHVFVSFSPSAVVRVFVSSLYVCLCSCVSQTVPGRPARRLSVHMKCQFHHKPKWRTYRISFHKEGTRHRQRDKRGKSKENY